jgi:hypothetical protein
VQDDKKKVNRITLSFLRVLEVAVPSPRCHFSCEITDETTTTTTTVELAEASVGRALPTEESSHSLDPLLSFEVRINRNMFSSVNQNMDPGQEIKF